jgi:hypothetical protein
MRKLFLIITLSFQIVEMTLKSYTLKITCDIAYSIPLLPLACMQHCLEA